MYLPSPKMHTSMHKRVNVMDDVTRRTLLAARGSAAILHLGPCRALCVAPRTTYTASASPVAKDIKATLGTKNLDAVADRGFIGEPVGTAANLPQVVVTKPLTSNARMLRFRFPQKCAQAFRRKHKMSQIWFAQGPKRTARSTT